MEENENKTKKKVGLALSGGFIRSTASIGVIEVLLENNIPIDMISGCSAGAGVASVYSSGKLEELKIKLETAPIREYWKIIFEPGLPKQGLLKGQRTREFLKGYIGDRNFKDLNLPTFLVATDLSSLSPVVLNEGKVIDALQASLGVAGLCIPVKYNGRILTDGGNFNLIPSQPLYANGADYVIAVDSSQPPNFFIRGLAKLSKMLSRQPRILNNTNGFSKDPHIGHLVSRAVRLSGASIENFHFSNYPYDTLIQPSVKQYKRWNVNKVKEIVEHGRKATEKMIPQIKKDLGIE